MNKIKHLMVALSAVFLVTVGLLSCDSDAVNINESSAVNHQARSLSEIESFKMEFSSVLQTEEYIDAYTSTNIFAQKLRIEDYYNLENEEDLIEWINSNPDSIEFSSPSEAISQYNLVKNKWINYYSVNSSFFTGLVDLNEFEIEELAKLEGLIFVGTIPIEDDPIISYSDCEKKCLIQGRECDREAQQVYEERLAGALLIGRLGFMPGAAAVAVNALIQRKADDRRCAREMLACSAACD